MDVFVFVLAIIIITTIAGLIKEQMKQRRKMENAVGADQQARIDKLEKGLNRANRLQRRASQRMEQRASQSARRIQDTYGKMGVGISAGFKKLVLPAIGAAGLGGERGGVWRGRVSAGELPGHGGPAGDGGVGVCSRCLAGRGARGTRCGPVDDPGVEYEADHDGRGAGDAGRRLPLLDPAGDAAPRCAARRRRSARRAARPGHRRRRA